MFQKQGIHNKKKGCRNSDSLHSDQKEKGTQQDHPPAFFSFPGCFLWSKRHIIEQQLSKNKGNIMNLQISCVAFCFAEGHQTGNQRLYARCNTKGWNLQYHDRPVCQTHADRKQIHCFCTKQIRTGKRRQNCNALEDHLGTAPDHGGQIHKIQNPDHHGPQKQRCDQGHVKQRRSFHPL